MFATSAEVPWMAPSDTTAKVWMLPLAMARQKKNSRLRRIGSAQQEVEPDLAVALLALLRCDLAKGARERRRSPSAAAPRRRTTPLRR